MNLPAHNLSIALVCPQIAPNTGNIARLCVASGTELHLIRPLGFVLSDRNLRRSAMDYWPRLRLTIHDDTNAFLAAKLDARLWLFSSKATRTLWDIPFERGDTLVFGNETHGLAANLHEHFREQLVRIPQVEGERCLNLSSAAAIGLYEAIRQISPSRPLAPPV